MKLRLTITSGTLAGREYDLETGFLTVGRSENCSVRFDPQIERVASKQHAFIEARVDGYYVTDNKSTNGTLVNGERVETARLSNGDEVRFGKNGVTARVDIFGALEGPESDLTKERFAAYQAAEYQHAAQNEPVSIQSSISQLGLGGNEVAAPKPSAPVGRYVGIGVTLFFVIFLSIFVGLIIFASLGVGPAIVAAVVAFVPAMVYLLPFMFLDRYDPEPLWLLALAFAWGALFAVVVSIFVNTAVEIGVGMAALFTGLPPELGTLAALVFSAPIFEEGSKGLGLLALLIFFRRYFDDILDGIVFAGVIALGFATVENVLYYGNGYVAGGFTSLGLLFVLRGILSPFAHATFTSMTGIGCGIARESHKTLVRIVMPIVGYVVAVSLHMLWNAMAFLSMFLIRKLELDWICDSLGLGGQNEAYCAFLLAYAVLEVPLFFFYVIFALLIMRRQNKILKDMLAMDIARGLIPEEHGKIATSAFRSSTWLIAGLFGGKVVARSRYLRAMGKLGLSYWHIQRATAAQGQTGSFQQNPVFREEILRWRDKV